MSTASSESHLPPRGVHGHGHSHSRSPRGHSRSGRWTSNLNSGTATCGDQQSRQEHQHSDASMTWVPCQIPEGIWSTNRSHFHPHSNASSSRLVSNGGRSDHGYKIPLPESLDGSSAGFGTHLQCSEFEISLSQGILAGILMAFPWVALSWYLKQYTTLVYLDGEDWLQIRTVQTKLQGAELRAGLLVSFVTLLVATWSALLRKQSGQGLASAAEPGVSKLSWAAARSSMLNILVFGLPIYAAMKIGAVIVAMALLLSSASGVPSLLNDGCNIRVTWKSLKRTKFSLLVLSILVVLNAFGLDAAVDANSWQGYLALFVSIFILPPSFLTAARNSQIGAKPSLHFTAKIVGSATSLSGQQSLSLGTSSIILSPPCTFFTIIFGILLLGLTVLLTLFDGKNAFNMVDLMLGVATATCFALPLISSAPSRIAARPKVGLAAALIFTCLFSALPHPESSRLTYVVWVSVATLSLVAARLDSPRSPTTHAHHSHNHSESELSIVTRYLIRHGESYPLLYSILKEDDSRRIFYFMCLNFVFMLVQLSYGFITGSLGLLSDSIHMFFDCLALVVGLCAAVMSKWPPSSRFPYGYGKVDTLSGFANGIFLMIISVEIIYEAIERLLSGSQMHRIGELLAVSAAGLAVNLVGIMAFDHAHHGHGHSHGHDHGHSHGHNENMHGIFLHILADTLGSVAVVISTILVHFYGWPGFDPLASCIIAILIFASAVPLVSSTAQTLLLSLPADVEYNLRNALGGVSNLKGVVGYAVPKFWLNDTGYDHGHHGGCHSHEHDHSHNHRDHQHHHEHHYNPGNEHDHSHCDNHENHTHAHKQHDHDHDHGPETDTQKVLGVIHIIASRGADLEDVRHRTVGFLRQKKMDLVVQVEREGDNRCWCGNGIKSP
ncbi:hypothetical protein Egran_06349 [Elaphomyces granulatus]|uniref:Zinc transporter n=1 Tax=Elaphomyces granulatus TaxID=519963 RepID=A0A232LNZ1_9EURO|nr:hypothetical protein Egran_06349 [Elaphomyces granulatus]